MPSGSQYKYARPSGSKYFVSTSSSRYTKSSNPTSSRYKETDMGCSPFKVSKSNYINNEKVKDINPQPNNYKIVKAEEINNYLVVMINYPNCTNYEGNKILVYKDINLLTLINQKLIDPHFSVDVGYQSPIARFVPTNEGWNMAIEFVKIISKGL